MPTYPFLTPIFATMDPSYAASSDEDLMTKKDVAALISGAVPVITETALPNATAGVSYSAQIVFSGNPSASLAIVGLPVGLTNSNGLITGIAPTAGTFDLVVTATNILGSDTWTTTLTVDASDTAPTITTVALADAMVGAAYSQPIAYTGSTATLSTFAGSLPAGLYYDQAAGAIIGTPTTAAVGASITVRATNGAGSDDQVFAAGIRVYQAPWIDTSLPLPTAQIGVAYSTDIVVSGSPTPTLTVVAGSLGDYSLSGVTISGTISEATTLTFTVRASAACGTFGTLTYDGNFTIQVTDIPPAGYIAWWERGLGMTLNANNKVTSWLDQTGNHTLEQATAAKAPTWNAANDSIDFLQSANQYMSCSDLSQNSPWTIGIQVYLPTTSNDTPRNLIAIGNTAMSVGWSNAANAWLEFWAEGGTYVQSNDGASEPAYKNTWRSVVVQQNGTTNSKISIDNTTTTYSPVATAFNLTTFYLNTNSTTLATESADFQIRRIVIYPNATVNLTDLYTYLSGGTGGEPPTTEYPTISDSRVHSWIDPRIPFAQAEGNDLSWQSGNTVANQGQYSPPNGGSGDFRSIPEPGLKSTPTEYSILRVNDPLDSSKKAYKHYIKNTSPTVADGTWRSEYLTGENVLFGVTYWIAFAMNWSPSFWVADDINYATSCWDMHETAYVGGHSSIGMLTRQNSGLYINMAYSSSNPYNSPVGEVFRTKVDEASTASNVWHKFVMQVKLHPNPANSPFCKLWRKTGSGATTLLFHDTQPNAYYTPGQFCFAKTGIYNWCEWNVATEHTMYTKGLYILRDVAGSNPTTLDVNSMMALLDSV